MIDNATKIDKLLDKLRKYANKVDDTFPMLSRAMRDAADTIFELQEYAHTLELEVIRLDSDNCDLRGELGVDADDERPC